MAYQRFALATTRSTPATVATAATVGGSASETVAGVAGVAGPAAKHATPYDGALAALLASNPTDDERRWLQACDDAALFLRDWGERAEVLGWSADDLFGLHPTAPLARYDAMGLLWLLRGRRVRTITQSEAILEGGLRFRREVKSYNRATSIT